MQEATIKVIDYYPEENFDQQRQREWVEAVVNRIYSYSAAAVSSSRRNDKWKQAV